RAVFEALQKIKEWRVAIADKTEKINNQGDQSNGHADEERGAMLPPGGEQFAETKNVPRGANSFGRSGHRWVGLLPENEIQAYAANFDEVAVVEAHGAGNGRAIDGGNLVAGAKVIAVVALIDLRGHGRFEPAPQAHRGHGRFADYGKLVGQHVFFLVDLAAEHDER